MFFQTTPKTVDAMDNSRVLEETSNSLLVCRDGLETGSSTFTKGKSLACSVSVSKVVVTKPKVVRYLIDEASHSSSMSKVGLDSCKQQDVSL